MYCEVIVEHKEVVSAAGLERVIGNGRLGPEILLGTAYGMSAIYSLESPTRSLFAFEAARSCFVIARKVNFRTSTYHIEGNSPAVSVETLFHAAREYSADLIAALREPPGNPYECRSLTVQLFEDNGRETGVEGKFVTLASVVREKFEWNELRSKVLEFVIAIILVYYGLDKESSTAAIASLGLVLAFTAMEAFLSYYRGRGTISWKLRQS